MTLEILQKEMISAMKSQKKIRKETISSLISAVKLMGINNGCRNNIPEEMVNAAILKEQKTIQEMIDTCPISRVSTLTEYKKRKAIIDEFAPKLMVNTIEIEEYILSLGIEIKKENRGEIMKKLKGKADMKIANSVLSKMMAL